MKELKNCETRFKEVSVNDDIISVKRGLDGIKSAYLTSLRELEEMGIFQMRVNVQHNANKRGRPEKIVDVEVIKSLGKSGMKLNRIADSLGCSYSKVYSTVKKNTGNAPTKIIHTTLSDSELDDKLNKFEEEHGRHGRRMTEGYLRSEGIILANAKGKIKSSNDRRQLPPLEIGHRLQRRCYQVRGPGSIYHIDSHHKLGKPSIKVQVGNRFQSARPQTVVNHIVTD